MFVSLEMLTRLATPPLTIKALILQFLLGPFQSLLIVTMKFITLQRSTARHRSW